MPNASAAQQLHSAFLWSSHGALTAILLTCTYGVVKKFRPATPFLTPYLESTDHKNFTDEQLYGEIYPCWTYANALSLVPIFIISDQLRYKPVIIFEALSLCTTWILLLFGRTIWQMQLMQKSDHFLFYVLLFSGMATSAEVAYTSYLYAMVDKCHYKRVTSYYRGATMLGKFLAFSTGQLLVWHFGAPVYSLLNEVSLAALLFCIPIAIVLPSVEDKTYNSKKSKQIEVVDAATELQHKHLETACNNDAEMERIVRLLDTSKQPPLDCRFSTQSGGKTTTLTRTIQFYRRNSSAATWSAWWILASCGSLQVFNYAQTLWALRQHRDDAPVANGMVEAINTLLGAMITFGLQFVDVAWHRDAVSVPLFVGALLAAGGALLWSTTAESILVDYISYLCVSCMFHALITIASNFIAFRLKRDYDRPHRNMRASRNDRNDDETTTDDDLEDLEERKHIFSTVFGINELLALAAQTLLTFIVADRRGPLALDIEQQFFAYAIYFLAVGALFAVYGFFLAMMRKSREMIR